jgi:hypothetical protein
MITLLKKHIRNYKRKILVSVNSKFFVAIISILSLVLTLFLVRFIKTYNTDESSLSPMYYEALRNNRNAYSLVFNTQDVPIDLIYPGVRVDVLEKKDEDIKYLVKNVYIVSVNFIDYGERVKIDLALNELETRSLVLSKLDNLVLLVKGHKEDRIDSEDIEIIEL